MPHVSLCERCSKTNFIALRYPTVSEIRSMQAGQTPRERYPFKVDGTARLQRFDLGLLSDLRNRRHCNLCMCIWRQFEKLQVPSDSGDVRVYSDSGYAALGQEVTCNAFLGLHWGLFRHDDTDKHSTLYRLSITTHISPDHEPSQQPHMYLDHFFQPCDIGAGSIYVNDKFQDPRGGINMTVFGGRRRPLQINVDWLRRWLSICEHEHGDVCGSTLDLGEDFNMKTVRFVDVNNRCIKTFHNQNLSKIRYIALSYVWGRPLPNSPPVLELNTSTAAELEVTGVLDRLGTPQTMVDVIELATLLDVPYVWIDRVCICQDDLNDKGMQISKMHVIYNASYITIVAAAGNDVHHGLPGLRPGTRHTEQEEILVLPPCKSDCDQPHEHDPKGISLLTSAHSFIREEHYLEDTIWNRRGWTMQERVLARRSLIFTDEQVYWACSDATFFEDSFCELEFPRFQFFSRRTAELNLKSTARTFSEHRDPKERSWATYTLLVRRYSRRLLTFEGDGYDAFAAILQAIQADSGETFLWGIPASHFELGLSWTTFEGQYRRTEKSTLPMTVLKRKVQFPSWSWMGWVGETHITVGNDRLESEQPTIKCYIHEPSNGEVSISPVWKQAGTAHSLGSLDFDQDNKPRNMTLADLQKNLPSLTKDYLSNVPSHHLLFFWTASAKFHIRRPRVGNYGAYVMGAAVGFVCISCHTVEQHITGKPAPESVPRTEMMPEILNSKGDVVGTVCPMREKHWKGGDYDDGLQEFIIVGRRHIAELGDEFPATLLVMQIERKGDVCYRVNMGEIGEAAWKEEDPEWGLVALG